MAETRTMEAKAKAEDKAKAKAKQAKAKGGGNPGRVQPDQWGDWCDDEPAAGRATNRRTRPAPRRPQSPRTPSGRIARAPRVASGSS